MNIPTLPSSFATGRSVAKPSQRKIRIGIPRALNVWSTHQFWLELLTALGGDVVFSSHTSDEQFRQFGKGRGTVDCCYPVKCMAGHYGELLFGQKRKIDVLFSPMIKSLPSFLKGHVVDDLSCPRVMAAPETIRAGYQREKDLFLEFGVRHLAPMVCLAEPELAIRQLHNAFAEVFPGLTLRRTADAVGHAYSALAEFDERMRSRSRKILEDCARDNRPCVLILARPYHMDPGIGHEIETELQAFGYPILWGQYLPLDQEFLQRTFGEDLASGTIKSPFDISDVWRSSYSANTNEMLWAAKVAAREPHIACVLRLSSYECGMDQPTFTPVQEIVERSGTLFFSFQELDSTKPAGSVRIRIETISFYLRRNARAIVERKLVRSRGPTSETRAAFVPLAAAPFRAVPA